MTLVWPVFGRTVSMVLHGNHINLAKAYENKEVVSMKSSHHRVAVSNT